MTRGIDGAREVAVHSLDYEHDREFVAESISSDTEAIPTHPDQDNLSGGLINRLPVQNRSVGAADWLGARLNRIALIS
ncbi:hypothetical protein ZIOFF_042582 [Zingiber officinale]|uniref:Uncharacterized protein n=1 Tax=Zingiber officinale TaxID=94328 RepID=A0A8J5FTQ4_ZINOF|nr:hypothetical protein ZIOFF_042582 [Zingiber officinale]